MMRRHVLALVLTLVVAGVPEALVVCHVVCASVTSHDEMASSHDHSGSASRHANVDHRPASSGSEAAVATDDHPCGDHGQRLSALTIPTPERPGTVAVASTVAVLLPPLALSAIHADLGAASRSPSVPLRTPLRI
jgi:hypothetical protein